MKLTASVIIPTKNAMPLLKEVIDSVLNQRCNFKYDVIVIDSGSKDGTVDFCKSLGKKIQLLEISPKHFGHGRTRNFGISRSEAEFCAFLTHDAKPLDENWLTELISPMLRDSEIAGVFGRHIAYPHASYFTKRDIKMHFDNIANYPILYLSDSDRYYDDRGYRQLLHYYSDNNSCLRKAVWEHMPYPDVNFAEDQLWAKKIIENGYKKAYADNAVVFHSHDYSPWETLMRSYDESSAFRRYFGYKLCSSIKDVQRLAVSHIRNDIKASENIFWYSKTAALHSLKLICKYIGWYFGSKNFKKNETIAEFLSIDQRLKRS